MSFVEKILVERMSESNVLQFQTLKENHEQASAFNEALGFKLHDSLANEFVLLSNRINRIKKGGVSKLEDFPNFDTPCYGMHRSNHRDSNRVTPQG